MRIRRTRFRYLMKYLTNGFLHCQVNILATSSMFYNCKYALLRFKQGRLKCKQTIPVTFCDGGLNEEKPGFSVDVGYGFSF